MYKATGLGIGLVALLSGAIAVACSSSDDAAAAGGGSGGADGGSGGSSGSGGAGGGDSGTGGGSGDGGECTVTVSPSADDVATIQTALDEVKSGSTVCFSPGTYKLKNHIVLGGANNVTFKGTGAKREDTLLDFTGQTAGEEGVLVTTDGFTVTNLWIKNTANNGIKVQAENSVFRNIKVSWDTGGQVSDAGPLSGAYAIYPTGCTTTLLEDNEVSGAADAGIYAGQCKHVIARRNHAHHNVLGIEIENTIDADVYDNDVHDNTAGFLLDLLPHLQQRTNKNYLVHDNHIHDNNTPNFAKKNTVAAIMPGGTGMMVLAASDVEITKNNIEGNESVPIIILSYDLVDIISNLQGETPTAVDPETNRWPARVFVHENTFANNGTNPQDTYAVFVSGPDGGAKTVPYTVLWDGIHGPNNATDADQKICLGAEEQKNFVNFKADTSLLDPTGWSTDVTDHKCTLPAIKPLTP